MAIRRANIVVATTNPGKLAELRQLFEGQPVVVQGLSEFADLPEAPEEGATFAQNARHKARYYSRHLARWVLADDSGLEVEALGGLPGVRSARLAGEGCRDRAEQDRANVRALLEMLAEVPDDRRQGRFCCCLCLHSPERVILEVQGIWPGRILRQARGANGFGYDPVFFLPDRGRTAAQLAPAEKNAISHRGRALRQLMQQWPTIQDQIILQEGNHRS